MRLRGWRAVIAPGQLIQTLMSLFQDAIHSELLPELEDAVAKTARTYLIFPEKQPAQVRPYRV